VVELVLDTAGGIRLEVIGDVRSPFVLPLDPDRDRSLHGNEHALQRQASLVGRLDLLAALYDLRVDERGRPLPVAPVENEEPAHDADLRRRKPDADRVDHERLHPVDESPQIVVERLDRLRPHAQGGIRVLPNLREREVTSSVSLGVELLVSDLPLDLTHCGHTSAVDRREREAIMRQGVARPETPRDRLEREALESDLLESPVAGKPLERRLRNFRPSADAAVRALGGPLAWMRRLREIEVRIAEHETRLAEARELLRAEYDGDEEGLAHAWRSLAESWSFRDVNELIERHNRNFPAEARLPMNPRTGDFVHINGRPYTRQPLDADWVLARFSAGEPS
jgi:hypothetical protein